MGPLLVPFAIGGPPPRFWIETGPSSPAGIIYKYVCLRVDIRIMVMGDAIDIVLYGRRTPELSKTQPCMKQDTTSIGKYTLKP